MIVIITICADWDRDLYEPTTRYVCGTSCVEDTRQDGCLESRCARYEYVHSHPICAPVPVLNSHFPRRIQVLDANLWARGVFHSTADVNSDIFLLPLPDVHPLVDAAGDKICLFGFSRGAYIASALAGMLHKVGLLPPWNIQQVPFAYKMYKSGGDDQDLQRKEFKNHFSIHVDIDFIGVW